MSASPVLLVHGLGYTFTQNWQETGWVDVLKAEGLAPRPVRLPGHDGAPLDRSPADAVLAAAGDSPANAVGFSAGAAAVLDAAATEPNRFARIAVLGVGDHVLTEPDMAGVRSLAATLREPTEPADAHRRTFWRMIRRGGHDPDKIATFLETAPLSVPSGRVARINCPVLVVIGARDDAMPADRLVGTLPDARLLVLPGVDHLATPSALAAMDAVARFLAG